jgi:hypothetical protein
MYALDTQSARKADSTGNQIKEIGKYTGKFTQAEDITAKSGTRGIALEFEAASGQKARLSIYTLKADGTRIMGFDMLMALMACMKLRDIKPQVGTVGFYDFDTKQESTREGSIFPDLCGKPIGLLLETEEYEKADGSVVNRMVLSGCFQADTELTASEILDRKTSPVLLEKMVARLHHRPLKTRRAPQAAMPAQGGAKASSGFDDMDDDIPFASPHMEHDPMLGNRKAKRAQVAR